MQIKSFVHRNSIHIESQYYMKFSITSKISTNLPYYVVSYNSTYDIRAALPLPHGKTEN